MNTEGLSSPRMRCRSASLRRHFLFFVVTSCWTCLTLFNLLTLTLSSFSLQGIVCKHPLLLSRSSVRHSSSKLDSALAQSQISASHREPFLAFLRGQILKRVQDDGVWGIVYIGRLEDGWLWGFGGLKSSDALPFRIFQTPCLCVSYLTIGWIWSVHCLKYNFWFVFCCFANGQWLTANGCFVVWNSAAKIQLYFVKTK